MGDSERRAGALILEANRMTSTGRLAEAHALYVEALEHPSDARSRFVTLLNLGEIRIALSENDPVLREQHRRDAVGAWLEALKIDEGGPDRAHVALATGNLFLENGNLARASSMFRCVLEYDDPPTQLTQLAHERLGLTNREIGIQSRSIHTIH